MYKVSHIYTDNSSHASFTIVHSSVFDISTLIPVNPAVIKASLSTSNLEVSASMSKIIDSLFLKRKCEFIVFNDDFDQSIVTKYLMVMANKYKPVNKFESLLQRLDLLHASLSGVKVEILNKSDEFSKEFGHRVFEHNGEIIVCLKDSAHANVWLDGNSKYTSCDAYRSTNSVKIISINGIKLDSILSRSPNEARHEYASNNMEIF